MLRSYSKWLLIIALPAWVFAGYYAAQVLIGLLLSFLSLFNISIDSINKATLNTTLAAIIYALTMLIVIGIPWLVKKQRTSMSDLGLSRLPTWADIFMTPVGLVVYVILSTALISLATHIFPWFDVNQVQDTGFDQLNFRYEYLLAFITLVIIAPVAEEVLFRGYLFGKLKEFVPVWVAILATSLLFGAVHGEWNLAVDTFSLSVVLCLLRESTGNIWTSILLHMTKNGIAFYFLFINPSILTTLGK
jgi:uncharacterized protein